MNLCKGLLKAEGPLCPHALAERAVKASGLDETDSVLAKSIASKLVQAMHQQHLRE